MVELTENAILIINAAIGKIIRSLATGLKKVDLIANINVHHHSYDVKATGYWMGDNMIRIDIKL